MADKDNDMSSVHMLYSEKALELFHRALQHVEETAPTSSSSPHQYAATASASSSSESSDQEGSEEESMDNSSSSSRSQQSVQEEEAQNSNESQPNEKNETSRDVREEPKTSKYVQSKQKKLAQKEQYYILKQSDKLPRLSFDLSSTLELKAPLLLLDKHQQKQHSVNPVDSCRACISTTSAIVQDEKPIIVLLLKSGRFAGGVFVGAKCMAHKVHSRYTIRKKQGKAQSSLDSSKQKANSMGAQLRRAGELSLKEDVADTLKEWKSHIDSAAMIWTSCPPQMKRTLFDEKKNDVLLQKGNERVRKIPLDVGRPTYEGVCTIYNMLMEIHVREKSHKKDEPVNDATTREQSAQEPQKDVTVDKTVVEPIIEITPLGPLHKAAARGDLVALQDLLEESRKRDEDVQAEINICAGPDHMTPLHYAANSTNNTKAEDDDPENQHDAVDPVDPTVAGQCVGFLLEQCGSNPCVVDGRNRVAYFLATHEKVRDAFRLARFHLGENKWDWDKSAKVGPPLENAKLKQSKAAEKKRRQRARQKERKAKERAEREAAEKLQKQQQEEEVQRQNAKRIRDGLAPKTGTAKNVCDYCQKAVKNKKAMFQRLEYRYCSSECVLQHKRELMATAAMARLGG